MSHEVDNDRLLRMYNLVDNAVVAHTQLVESSQIPCEYFWLDLVQVLREPAHSINNSPRYGSIQFGQITGGCFQDANLIHGLFQPKFSNHVLQ
jgi:hypothetical protein